MKFSILWKPPFRIFTILLLLGVFLFLFYVFWQPVSIDDTLKANRQKNALWLSHGWIGGNGWFVRYGKKQENYRSLEHQKQLAQRIKVLDIQYLYPHLCPSRRTGEISSYDQKALHDLTSLSEAKVLPWVGGVLDENAFPDQPKWRENFIQSILQLLELNPKVAGVHVNIEPLPSGNKGFLLLLQELRNQMGADKVLSVACYPPPIWFKSPREVHWEENYYREVSKLTQQNVVMMYDSCIMLKKLYQKVYADWVVEVLAWSGEREVLLGIPAYEDEGVAYHYPEVENVENALIGLYGGLSKTSHENYAGIAIYSDWVLDEKEVKVLQENFINR